jgi:eukaryotic-like serine/threonine-protein kinase
MSPQHEAPAATTCTACGAGLRAGERYCGHCGTGTHGTPGARPGPAAPTGSLWSWDAVLDRLRAATLGEFEIVRRIGQGGMAAVFLARDLALNRNVAIKVMSPAMLMADGMVDRFREEAITVARLDHPNIVTIHAVRRLDELHFFVMKFVEGRSLDYVLQQSGPLSIAMVRGIVHQVGSGLEHAHRNGVIHRDVKPANLLIDSQGTAIVTDFGIAKVSEAPGLTQTGLLIGTAAYISPEQYLGAPASPASDQYALGVVIHEMLTGQVPFAGTTMALVQALLQQPAPGVRLQRPDCEPAMEAAITRMLAKDPADRWPTLREALRALGAAPLAEDDAELRELARRAVPDAEIHAAAHMAAPESPVPRRVGRIAEREPRAGARVGQADDSATAPGLHVTPPAAPVCVGQWTRLVAELRDARGQEPDSPLEWTTSDASVAVVSGDGIVLGIAPGAVTIRVRAGDAVGELGLRVEPAPAASLRLVGAPDRLSAGGTARLAVEARDAHSNPIPAPSLRWTSSEPAVLSVDGSGTLTAHAPGRATISAGCGDVVAHAVVEIHERVSVDATPPRDRGAPAAGPRRRRWQSRRPVPAWAAAGGAGVLVVAVAAAVVLGRGDPAERPAPVEPVLGGAFTNAAPAVDPTAPDADPPSAEPAGSGDQPTEPAAASALSSAAGEPDRAAPRARLQPEAAASPPVATPEQQAEVAVRQFVNALATGRRESIRSAYAGLQGGEAWLAFLEAHAEAGLRVGYFAIDAAASKLTADDAAEVRFDVGFTHDRATGPQPYTMLARLRRDGQRWRIVEVRYW